MEGEDPSEMLHKLVLEDDPAVDRLTDCFRSLRNSCASDATAQTELGMREGVLHDANKAIGLGLSAAEEDEQWSLCLRISAQFLGNLTVNNPRNQRAVWDCCCSLLKTMTQRGDPKLTNICLMVLYNILLGCPNLTPDLVNDQQFLGIILQSGADGLEFAEYIVEHLLTQQLDWAKVYNEDIPVAGRLFFLGVVEKWVRQSAEKVPTSLTQHLASRFCRLSDCVLRTLTDKVDTLEPVEVATLLRLLASCSPLPPHSSHLQEHKSLLINCAFLLRGIHQAGKEGDNCFSPVHKLSAVSGGDDDLAQHPAFALKASLVQLLGNLCHRHHDNQNMMRELEVIPVLLDCCNIDARNPFIIQWVVLAVRNLCEGNAGNQAVIAGLTRDGVVQSSVLTELGLTLHSDGGEQIRIAPLQTRNS